MIFYLVLLKLNYVFEWNYFLFQISYYSSLCWNRFHFVEKLFHGEKKERKKEALDLIFLFGAKHVKLFAFPDTDNEGTDLDLNGTGGGNFFSANVLTG